MMLPAGRLVDIGCGPGQYNNHNIRATLVDGSGATIASDEVDGIVRSNACIP